MSDIDADSLDWAKVDGLMPAILQDADTGEILMLGYINREALEATRRDGLATFYSRTKQRLWRKGETSGNTLAIVSIAADCDRDALLIRARPAGVVCHKGTRTCFGDRPGAGLGFLAELREVIRKRKGAAPEESYVAKLFSKGLLKIAQKVGEEGVETALAGAAEDDGALREEAADLLFHLMVLLEARGLSLGEAVDVLEARHGAASR